MAFFLELSRLIPGVLMLVLIVSTYHATGSPHQRDQFQNVVLPADRSKQSTNVRAESEIVDLSPVVHEFESERSQNCRTIISPCKPLEGKKCGPGVRRGYISCPNGIQVEPRSSRCHKTCPEKRKCRNPGLMENGNRSTNRNYTKSVKYSCKTGYLMVGQALMKCFVSVTGPQWRSPKPRCFREGGPYDRAWSDWSPCSSSCGAGTQKRQRMACKYNPADKNAKRCREQFRVCNVKPCESAFARRRLFSWTEWSPCEAGERFRFRRRKASDDSSLWRLANLTISDQPEKVSFQVDACCPLFRSTLRSFRFSSELRRATSRLRCPRGRWSRTGYRDVDFHCDECPRGKYAACKGQTSCVQCPIGYTTARAGSTSLAHCIKIKKGVNYHLTTLAAAPFTITQ